MSREGSARDEAAARGSGEDVEPCGDPRADAALEADVADIVRQGMPRGEVVDHAVGPYRSTVNAPPKLSDAGKTKAAAEQRKETQDAVVLGAQRKAAGAP